MGGSGRRRTARHGAWAVIERNPAGEMMREPPTAWSDEVLLGALVERDRRAWSEFDRRFGGLVTRCILKVTSRFHRLLSSDDAEDVRGKFMLALSGRDMQKLRAFDGTRGCTLGTWIGLLVTRAAWDHVRAVARRPVMSPCEDWALVDEEGGDAFDALSEKQQWGRVVDGVGRMSARDQAFVQLLYVDGRSPEEVAETLQISVKTVYSKKHKIRCRLERDLEPFLTRAA